MKVNDEPLSKPSSTNYEMQNPLQGGEEYEEDQFEPNEEITEEQMLDTAEQIFALIADCLVKQQLNVANTFGSEDMIHVLPNFEGEDNVEVMTADDFLTRCY